MEICRAGEAIVVRSRNFEVNSGLGEITYRRLSGTSHGLPSSHHSSAKSMAESWFQIAKTRCDESKEQKNDFVQTI